jgi:membrane protease YdiL (CAAX protease family)
MQYSGVFGIRYLLKTNLFSNQPHSIAVKEAAGMWACISFVVGLIIILILLRTSVIENKKKLDKPEVLKVIRWSAMGYFLAMVIQIICIKLIILVFDVNHASQNTEQILEIARLNPAFIIIPSLIAPILEEIIFRKILFGSLSKRLHFILAAGISSSIFAFMHGDLPFFLSYFGIGMLFCFLYKRTNNLLVPILTHMLMNSFVVIQQLHLLNKMMH